MDKTKLLNELQHQRALRIAHGGTGGGGKIDSGAHDKTACSTPGLLWSDLQLRAAELRAVRPTWKQVRAFCEVLDRGVTVWRTSAGDIKVAWGKGDQRCEYFANDLCDALGTIKANFAGASSYDDAVKELA